MKDALVDNKRLFELLRANRCSYEEVLDMMEIVATQHRKNLEMFGNGK